MILLRGIKGEEFARKIENGIVDCRDLLSTILQPPTTGYLYSDYYEKNIVKALTYCVGKSEAELHDPLFLQMIISDRFIPYIYLTYFHILNDNSLEWLDSFEDDFCFIAVDVTLDRVTGKVIGNEFWGSKMTYVDNISMIDQNSREVIRNRSACLCSIEELFHNKKDTLIPMNIYSTLSFPFMHREMDDKYGSIENEFRIMAYDCPRIVGGLFKQHSKEMNIQGGTGIQYSGVINSEENDLFTSNNVLEHTPQMSLLEVLMREKGNIFVKSTFKSIDIRDISKNYWYVGDKEECKRFVDQMLKHPPKESFVEKTRLIKYRFDQLKKVEFYHNYQIVKY